MTDPEWWTTPMRTEFGARVRALFAHPCDGGPYGACGWDDERGSWVRVEDVIGSVRQIEDDLLRRGDAP